MKKFKIFPNPTFVMGHVSNVLSLIGVGPHAVDADGTVTTMLTDDQKEQFIRRGGAAHRMEEVVHSPAAAPAPVAVAADPEPEPEPEPLPTLETVMAAGYTERAAKKIIRREELMRMGGTPEAIEEVLRREFPEEEAEQEEPKPAA